MKLKVTNYLDLENARQGVVPPESVRSEVVDGLVDTGATMLMLPADLVERLGLPRRGERPVKYANGAVAVVPLVGAVLVELLGRDMECEALVEAVGTTPLIGQLQLEALDLIVDAKTREARVNPAHPDAPLLDLLRAS